MKVAIHQPNFLPWLGYFYKMSRCDLFILLDDVQVSKNSYFNRTSLKGGDGNPLLVSLPLKKFRTGTPISDVCFSKNYPSFVKDFDHTLRRLYGKSAHFKTHFENIKTILQAQHHRVWEMNRDLITYGAKALGINCKIIPASSLSSVEKKEARIIDLVKKAGGSVYISGNGARNYQNEDSFHRAGIQLEYSEF
jgi:hypothetical protein